MGREVSLMRNKTLYLLSVSIAMALILPMAITSAKAPHKNEKPMDPGWLPATCWGNVYIDGQQQVSGPIVESWIDGVQYDEGIYFDPNTYVIDVMWDTNIKDLEEPVYEKDGAYWNDIVLFSISYGNDRYWANETMVWERALAEMVDLHFSTADNPPSLKVNEICPDNGAGEAYCTIYNPTDSDMDLADFYLEKVVASSFTQMGDEGDYDGPSVQLAGSVGSQQTIYIDLVPGFLDTVSDELKLVWNNTGTSVAGGHDIAIDRVEYGNQIYEPDNTVMPDASSPASGYSLKRVIDGYDTDDCFIDFEVVKATQTFDIDLIEGWNFISFPLELDETDLRDILSGISWSCVQWYDASDPVDHWKLNDVTMPDVLLDLWTLDHKMSFWLKANNSDTLVIRGTQPDTTTIHLYAGWNMVGYPSLADPMPVSEALWGTGADKVYCFNSSAPYFLSQMGAGDMMVPGYGYRVHVPADSDWIIDG